jgi:hypothetical protein
MDTKLERAPGLSDIRHQDLQVIHAELDSPETMPVFALPVTTICTLLGALLMMSVGTPPLLPPS